MNPVVSVLSISGRTKLAGISKKKTLFAFDYDGTLAPINSDPYKAFIPDQTSKLMRELSRLAPVAVISGRGRNDLKDRLGFEPSFLIGNHGIEDKPYTSLLQRKIQKNCLQWSVELQPRLPSGVMLENKKFSLSLHYRHCDSPPTAYQQLLRLISNLPYQPQIILGKYVINLLDPRAPHKGHVLEKILRRFQFEGALYMGDDETDENVFALSNQNILSVVVGRKIKSAASFYLDRQSHINRVLHILIENLSSVHLGRRPPHGEKLPPIN